MSGFVTVSMRQGSLRGRRRQTPAGSSFLSFHGVPYAKPPLGSLRFKAPELPEPWTGIRDATKEGNKSVQYDTPNKRAVGDEDCLVLNIFTPRLPTGRTEGQPLAVLVWIHGGGFSVGSCSQYDPEPFMDYGVVVVGINYRLGPLGFLSLGTVDAPGNAGLKDQTMALRWVKENISTFGGDPDNITIFGESAGGASVHYQLLSPLAKGLFRRAIAQSGSAFMPGAISKDPVGRAKRLAQAAGCEPSLLEKPDALLRWLRQAPAAALVEAATTIKTPEEVRRGLVFSFVPCVEPAHPGAFLAEEPAALAARGAAQRVPLLLGLTSHEGILLLPGSLIRLGLLSFADLGEEQSGGPTKKMTPAAVDAAVEAAQTSVLAKMASNLDRLLPDQLLGGHRNLQRTRQQCERIKDFFFDGKQLSEETLEGLVHILSDLHFGLGIMRAAREHVRLGVPVYLYEFAFQGESNFMTLLTRSKVRGACHGDELGYQFAMENVPPPREGSPEDLTRKRLALMWTNFAKGGNPTPSANDVVTTSWLPFSEYKSNYLKISDNLDAKVGLLKERIQFWEDLRT